jgi:hypothetical protein
MIEGLKVDVPYAELVKHLEARRAYHLDRANHYRGQHTVTLRDMLDRKVDGHTERADWFKVFAEHLVTGETYRLDDQDLLSIEMLNSSNDSF